MIFTVLCKTTTQLSSSMVAQWFEQSPHSKKVLGSIPGLCVETFCVYFLCTPRTVYAWFYHDVKEPLTIKWKLCGQY